ncbi:DUF4062 domain-containing protein [Salinibacterium sp. ZJ454]|uniref:ATP-binding protein n=1 Tax=Salinibacterium sp. ZJ454 TaxID=2708339 RepID=UPI0014221564|nr:DUF4062 domain-containing protein [Salinibacterium sp. ZJ454]
MGGAAGVIRTPDQRLRVFVSSTLRELASERRVVRAVIERLALAPVMFELGARPHPPRSLYRAYLAQSDIFVGVYWESYGWVAPGEEVSGLEDEYDLTPDVPLLIYVKRSEQRHERLEALLDRIRNDDRASYVEFDDAEELGSLLTSDLATLLAERFDESSRRRGTPLDATPNPASSEFLSPPASLTRLVGREPELARVIQFLSTDADRLVTLTGPGGIGKSRLAIAAARALEASFPDGIAFVDLAPIRDPGLVVSAIATALGIRDTDHVPLHEKLAKALDHRRVLLLLDNVEHVIAAAADLSALLSRSSVSMLATSRLPLRIDGEQSVPLTPLPSATAIELFVERARAVKPEFELTPDNEADVAAIASALDNVPLALELAAARLRVLTPAALAERLDHALPLLVGGARDRPERQRTLRATIDWSAQLLSEQESTFLCRLAVFRSGFALDAAEWMCEDLDPGNAVDLLAALVDSSLVQEQDRGSHPWFSMLATVREYARDELERRGELQRSLQRHAAFYSELAVRAEPHLIGTDQSAWMARLRDEFEDIRAAVDHYFRTEQGDAVTQLLWPLYWFWWTTGRLPEARDWVARLADVGYPVTEQTRFRVRFYLVGLATWKMPDPSRIPDLQDCLSYFVREHDLFGEFLAQITIAMLELMHGSSGLDAADEDLQRVQAIAEALHSPFLAAMALLIRGRSFLARGDVANATATFEASLDAAKASGEVLSQSAALYELGWVQMLLGEHGMARDYFVQQLLISSAVGHEEGIAYGLEGLFAVEVEAGAFERAGRFLGAADDTRERKGLLGPGIFSYHQRVLGQVEASPAAEEFTIAREQGRHADIAELLEEALT